MTALVGTRVDIGILNIIVVVSSGLGVGSGVSSVDVPTIGGEELVDLLKVPALGLRKHKVDDRNPTGVEDGKDDVGPPLDVLESARCELYDLHS